MLVHDKSWTYTSRPIRHWSFGGFLSALLILFFVMAIRDGTPLLVWRAWPAYLVTAIFAPIALLMLSVPSIEIQIDAAMQEVIVARRRLIGPASAERVELAAVASVEVSATETSDGDTYHVQVMEAGGNRHRVTAIQISSKKRAEAIAASIRAQIDAARGAPA